jgi:hypothetical protein
MAAQQVPGGYWSASNPIPTIQKFVENLDKDKKDRDQKIDEEIRRKQEASQKSGEPVNHEALQQKKKNSRQVTDPVTGREIDIEDVGKDYMKGVKDPKVIQMGSSRAMRDQLTALPAHCS